MGVIIENIGNVEIVKQSRYLHSCEPLFTTVLFYLGIYAYFFCKKIPVDLIAEQKKSGNPKAEKSYELEKELFSE